MILQFSVSNFRSFRERQTLSFAASNDDSLPENNFSLDLPDQKGRFWNKAIALYGANASGKSTVLLALNALVSLVKTSAKNTDPEEELESIEPFALDESAASEPCWFAVMFVADSLRYEYQVAATRKQIWHESLRAFPEGKEQMWFRRDYSLQTEEYAWSSFNPAEFGLDTSIVKRTLPNVLFLSKAIAENSVKLRPVFNWFINTLRFHNFSSTGGEFLDEHFTSEKINQKSPICSQIKRLLQHADIGITDVKVVEKSSLSISIPDFVLNGKKEFKNFDKKPKREVKINLVPELLHQNEKGSAGFLPWENESEGTQHLFSLIGPWLEAFEKGHILCIDELENSLHPFLFQELLKLIFNTEVNPKHVQIIFTTHNPLLLDTDILRRDQIWFTEKNKNGEAHLYPLTNFAPRYTESLFRGYLSGRYGGVPFIPNGLIAEINPTDKGGDNG